LAFNPGSQQDVTYIMAIVKDDDIVHVVDDGAPEAL